MQSFRNLVPSDALHPESPATGKKSALKTKSSGSIHIEPEPAFVCSKLV